MIQIDVEAKDGGVALVKRLQNLGGALREVAAYLEGDVKTNISKGIDYEGKPLKPLRPNTVASKRQRRKASGILQSDGLLRASVISRSGADYAEAGWLSPAYVIYVVKGTRPYTIRPRSSGVLRFLTSKGYRSAKVVNHPGLPPREVIGIGDRQIAGVTKILSRYLND